MADGASDATVHVDGTISFAPNKDTIKDLMKKVHFVVVCFDEGGVGGYTGPWLV